MTIMNNEELDAKSKQSYKPFDNKDKFRKFINISKISQEPNVDLENIILEALKNGVVYTKVHVPLKNL
jgi:hypothetical protein